MVPSMTYLIVNISFISKASRSISVCVQTLWWFHDFSENNCMYEVCSKFSDQYTQYSLMVNYLYDNMKETKV